MPRLASGTEGIAVIPLVANEGLGARQTIDQEGGTSMIAHLAFAEQQQDRPALPVTHSVELGVQAAFGASDTSGNSPFL